VNVVIPSNGGDAQASGVVDTSDANGAPITPGSSSGSSSLPPPIPGNRRHIYYPNNSAQIPSPQRGVATQKEGEYTNSDSSLKPLDAEPGEEDEEAGHPRPAEGTIYRAHILTGQIIHNSYGVAIMFRSGLV